MWRKGRKMNCNGVRLKREGGKVRREGDNLPGKGGKKKAIEVGVRRGKSKGEWGGRKGEKESKKIEKGREEERGREWLDGEGKERGERRQKGERCPFPLF